MKSEEGEREYRERNTKRGKGEREIYKGPEVLVVKAFARICTHAPTDIRPAEGTRFSKLEVIDNNEAIQWLYNQ